jgi:hypothetical protein
MRMIHGMMMMMMMMMIDDEESLWRRGVVLALDGPLLALLACRSRE